MIRSLVVSLCCLAAACQADTVTLTCGTTFVYPSNPGLGSCLDSSGTFNPLKDLSVSADSSIPVALAGWSSTVTVDITSASPGLPLPGFPPLPVYLVPCLSIQGQKSGTDASVSEAASFGDLSLEAGWGTLFSCSSSGTEIPLTVGTPQTFGVSLSVSAEDGFNGAGAFAYAALDGFEVLSTLGLIPATITVDFTPAPEPPLSWGLGVALLSCCLLLIRRQNEGQDDE